ncbi:MAG: NrsF family protein [Bacteroidota bacterium]
MKTENLIDLLATGGAAVAAPPLRRYLAAIGWGALGAGLLMLVLLKVRDDLLQAVLLPMFWIKIGFVVGLGGSAAFATLRLSRPGARLARVPITILLPLLFIWAIAVFSWLGADSSQRSQLFFGETWKSCPLLIALLSIPAFVATMRAMRDMAPTRPCLAGSAAGLLAGTVAAAVYCLHCPEMGAPFIGFWYLLGMLLPAAAGALAGNRLLRW